MNRSSHNPDGDQDSLFGSPPPSPARGRSPSLEILAAGGETDSIVTVPGAVTCRKNVGTIALPGSHMSCAELPADLPASSLSLSRPVSSHSSGVAAPDIVRIPTSLYMPVVTSRSSANSASSRASSAASTVPSASASTKKRGKPKSKSTTPIPPPITLPGPNEPTPSNFLRSQSSLLGLAGVVGCVKPAQLYTHDSKPTPVQQPRSYTPIHGSTPANPIVIDEDQDIYASHIGKRPIGELQTPQHIDQLNPELFRFNITSSLTKEKNLSPVLESLIKLLGGEPHLPSANAPPQPFARPYGHGIFTAQPSSPISSLPNPSGSTTATVPPPKRRKLKHVPAGAADWDVPFPFAAGEGPKAYRDTWARDRVKQLATQLLELVQNAAKRAAIKTAKTEGKVSKRWTSARNSQSSRSPSVEVLIGQSSLAQFVRGSPSHTSMNTEASAAGTSADSLDRYLGLLETSGTAGQSASGSKDRSSVDSENTVEEGSPADPCDYSAFEEWLSQLQQFLPPETNPSPPESDWGARLSVPLDSLASGSMILDPIPDATRDQAIDPALLAISQQSESAPQSHTSASTATQGEILQLLDIHTALPALAHSPHTSLSSPTGPLTPLSETFTDVPTSMVAHRAPVHDPLTHQPVEKDRPSRPGSRVHATAPSSFPTGRSEPPPIAAVQKGKARADDSVASAMPSTSSPSTPGTVPTSKGTLNKHAILERAQERRRQLVAEIERAKVELWETTIENAVLVHLTRGRSL